MRGRHLTPADAKAQLTADKVQQASRHLQDGSCVDTLGWTHETAGRILQAHRETPGVWGIWCVAPEAGDGREDSRREVCQG